MKLSTEPALPRSCHLKDPLERSPKRNGCWNPYISLQSVARFLYLLNFHEIVVHGCPARVVWFKHNVDNNKYKEIYEERVCRQYSTRPNRFLILVQVESISKPQVRIETLKFQVRDSSFADGGRCWRKSLTGLSEFFLEVGRKPPRSTSLPRSWKKIWTWEEHGEGRETREGAPQRPQDARPFKRPFKRRCYKRLPECDATALSEEISKVWLQPKTVWQRQGCSQSLRKVTSSWFQHNFCVILSPKVSNRVKTPEWYLLGSQTVRALVAEAHCGAGDRRTLSSDLQELEGWRSWVAKHEWQSTMTPIADIVAQYFGQRKVLKSPFVVTFAIRTKREADVSAAEEFWKDPDVKETASTLPPSKKMKERPPRSSSEVPAWPRDWRKPKQRLEISRAQRHSGTALLPGHKFWDEWDE